jgi:lysine 2,3-aminomutase
MRKPWTFSIRRKNRDPFFINPYYLSLLNVNAPEFARGADMAIRYYIIYSRQLVQEYGQIVAWEKEDVVEPGKPNAAGWILPTKHNIHRRYPEVAIMIPDTMGRACAGLCASCQRMYDFQRGHLNFNLEKLKPTEAWDAKLDLIMKYWESDSRLRDILITGGDALMSANHSLKKILDAVYQMAVNKKKINEGLPDGKKYAEILRVRLGTRLPVYLPQRITQELTEILAEFKARASKIGVRQFVIQTHFQSPMEVTPESRLGISRLIGAGWTVANQLVFTAAASRRGHTAKLRKVLNDIGVLPYYTFSVKGYMENSFKFATNARAAQEQMEEKVVGLIPSRYKEEIKRFPMEAERLVENIRELREKAGIPFLATDRNVLNLPGVGKSMTYRVIGITRAGRRILEFDHDHTRSHSPIVDKIGKFVIIESKPVANYLEQLEDMEEDKREYQSIWGYSIGETEPRTSIYEYPEFDFTLTEEITNFKG